MDIEMKVSLHNEFDIEVRDAVTGELKQKGKAYNRVLDQMYTRLCARSAYFSQIAFGTGTGTLANNRTSLFIHLGNKAATDVEIVKDPVNNIFYWKRSIQINPEEFVGSTLTEVGILWGTTGTPSSNLVTHALIQDAEGNTISITKTSTDVIVIYATVYFQFSDNYGGQLMYTGFPNNNTLLNYLLGTSWPVGNAYLHVGDGRGANIKSALMNDSRFNAQVSPVADAANKKMTITQRLQVGECNFDIWELDLQANSSAVSEDNIIRAKFPIPGVWENFPITDEQFGTGDGTTTQYNLRLPFLKANSIVIKKNGTVVSNYVKTEYISKVGACGPRAYWNKNSENSFLIGGNGSYSDPVIARTPDNKKAIIHITRNSSGSPTRYKELVCIDDFTYLYGLNDAASLLTNISNSNMCSYAFSPDGTEFVVGLDSTSGSKTLAMFIFNDADNTFAPVDISSWFADPLKTSIYSVEYSPDGNYLAISTNFSSTRYLEIYKRVSGHNFAKLASIPQPASAAYSAKFSPDGNYIAVGCISSPSLRVYSRNGDTFVNDGTIDIQPGGSLSFVKWSPDNIYLAVYGASTSTPLCIYRRNGNNYTKISNPPGIPTVIQSTDFSPDGKLFAVGFIGSGIPFSVFEFTGGGFTKIPDPDLTFSSSFTTGAVSFISNTRLLMTGTYGFAGYTRIFEIVKNKTRITFDTPPAVGDVLTYSALVDYIPKDINHVLDVTFTIQFGEGSAA